MRINLEPLYRSLIRKLIHIPYNISYYGFEKIPKDGPALIIANHVAYIDGVIIQGGCDRPIRFVIDKFIYEVPIINHFMRHNKAIPILAKKEHVEYALDEVSRGLEEGHLIGIFPEGQMTYTGNLGRFKPGIEWILERTPVPVYPVILRGLWGSVLSRKYRHSRFRFIPKHFRKKIIATCGDPIAPEDAKINYLQRVFMQLRESTLREHE